jgi:carbon-monoxide dehydrogenase small subunit
MLAVQADGRNLTTIEGLGRDGVLHPIQQAFVEEHGLQCGFCTPGFVMSVHELLELHPDPSDEEIRDFLGGNLCRCTGYQAILRSVKLAARRLREPKAQAEQA